jgi:hypothetical protein
MQRNKFPTKELNLLLDKFRILVIWNFHDHVLWYFISVWNISQMFRIAEATSLGCRYVGLLFPPKPLVMYLLYSRRFVFKLFSLNWLIMSQIFERGMQSSSMNDLTTVVWGISLRKTALETTQLSYLLSRTFEELRNEPSALSLPKCRQDGNGRKRFSDTKGNKNLTS